MFDGQVMTQVRAQVSGGMLPKRDRPEVRVIDVGFGGVTANGPQAGYWPKARVWLLAATESDIGSNGGPTPDQSEFALYVPGPDPNGYRPGLSNDNPVRRSFGPVESVRIDGRQWQVVLQDGTRASVTLAPCGCGGGLLAQAGPIDGPFRIQMIRAPGWVQRGA